MSNYRTHAEREFKALGYDLADKEEGPNRWIMDNIFQLLDVFSTQGHSGSSAPYCVRLFAKLALFEPACPLTGKPEEWNAVGADTWQNNRCSHVFKGLDGRAYDIDGRVFRDPDGCCYTNFASRVFIEFPYTPTTEYVARPHEGEETT